MPLIDGLIKLLEGKFQFKADVKVDKIEIGCNHTVNYNPEIKVLVIDPRILDLNKQEQLGEIISKSLENGENAEGYLILNESKQKLEEISFISSKDPVLSFFEDKIAPLDYSILKIASYCSSLYLRGENQKGDQVKYEAICRYGDIAKNIINIYCAGYFETTLCPLYEILEGSGDEKYLDKFREMYRIIVTEEIFTLFVNTSLTKEKAILKLKEKIVINKQYGAYKINIHGINKTNVSTIKFLIEQIKDDIDGEPIIVETGNAIMVKIKLKKETEMKTNISTQQRSDLVSLF